MTALTRMQARDATINRGVDCGWRRVGWMEPLWAALEARGVAMWSLGSPFSIASLLGALVVATWLFVERRRQSRAPGRIPDFLKAVFPRRIMLHPSTMMDLRMYVLNGLLFGSTYGLAVLASPFWRDGMLHVLTGVFGAHAPLVLPGWAVLAIVTPVDVLAVELGYWLAHFLMHKLPSLWEFHKMHHSAEVMTPLTEWRQHPVEMILFPNLMALSTGLTYGVLVHCFGEIAQPLTLFQVNVVLLLFFLTISHLRHSHVWLPLTGVLGHLIQSPAHHQIHHSTKPAHFDKNLGFALALWDWLFGTLCVPHKAEAVTFGLGAESREFDRLGRSFCLPFAKAWAHLRAPQTSA